MIESQNKNKGGKILLLIFLLICSGLGIAAFVMSFTKKCNDGFKTTGRLRGNEGYSKRTYKKSEDPKIKISDKTRSGRSLVGPLDAPSEDE